MIVQNHGYASIGGLSEQVGGEGFGTAYRFPGADGTSPAPRSRSTWRRTRPASAWRSCAPARRRSCGTALAAARASPGPTAVHVETDPARARPPAEAWWDVPVAEVSDRAPARAARTPPTRPPARSTAAPACSSRGSGSGRWRGAGRIVHKGGMDCITGRRLSAHRGRPAAAAEAALRGLHCGICGRAVREPLDPPRRRTSSLTGGGAGRQDRRAPAGRFLLRTQRRVRRAAGGPRLRR